MCDTVLCLGWPEPIAVHVHCGQTVVQRQGEKKEFSVFNFFTSLIHLSPSEIYLYNIYLYNLSSLFKISRGRVPHLFLAKLIWQKMLSSSSKDS